MAKVQGSEAQMDFCDQGHPAHDPSTGCGPCLDEMLAMPGSRREFAFPRMTDAEVDSMLREGR